MWWSCRWEAVGVSYRPSTSVSGSSVPPLSRPQLAEGRRVRAVELFEEGGSNVEIARVVGVGAESVRGWRRVWEEGGAPALRRRSATGRRAHPVRLERECGPLHGPARRTRKSGCARPIGQTTGVECSTSDQEFEVTKLEIVVRGPGITSPQQRVCLIAPMWSH
ncbi:helix-turn-helix domain-containing protein [Streptomyces sp. NPDC015032]|uniref:helix-turn-helix domain-containing protein n=1 Tax=Streptomyces sp. NPDC015032 TaxID=3364937 RepID=UPI0036F552A2